MRGSKEREVTNDFHGKHMTPQYSYHCSDIYSWVFWSRCERMWKPRSIYFLYIFTCHEHNECACSQGQSTEHAYCQSQNSL